MLYITLHTLLKTGNIEDRPGRNSLRGKRGILCAGSMISGTKVTKQEKNIQLNIV